jgi:GNAT superfamily N-acetyltransferase
VDLEPAAGAAGAGSLVLREAWAPPCLHYTPDYLRYQLGFPGEVGALAAVARAGEEPAGFAASTPRRVRLDGRDFEVHVVSFVAVRPRFRQQGLAARLYAALLGRLRARSVPIVTFAQPGSPGERAIAAAYDAAGLSLRPLRPHGVYGARARRTPSEGAPSAPPSDAELGAQLDRCRDETTLFCVPTAAERAHVVTGRPGAAAFVAARSVSGDPLGAGVAACTEVLNPDGPAQALSLETVFLPEADPDALRGLVHAAAQAFPEAGPTVLLPTSLPPEALAAAGLRRTPASWSAFAAAAEAHHPVLQAAATSLAVA